MFNSSLLFIINLYTACDVHSSLKYIVHLFKGTVSVNSSDPPYKNSNARITTVSQKLFLVKNDLDIYVILNS